MRRAESSLISLGTTELHSDVTTTQRLSCWQGELHKFVKTEARLCVQQNHRTCSGTCGWSGQNIESCTGAPYWRQSPPDASILCCLVEFTACLTNRCEVGSDGKTPLHRLHGRKYNTPILEFGRKILYTPVKPVRGGFVGMLNSSSLENSGCHRARVGDQRQENS